MRLYEDIIRERSAKGPDYLNALLEVERKRDYRVREDTLRRDIELLQARIAGIRRDFYPIKEEVSPLTVTVRCPQCFIFLISDCSGQR